LWVPTRAFILSMKVKYFLLLGLCVFAPYSVLHAQKTSADVQDVFIASSNAVDSLHGLLTVVKTKKRSPYSSILAIFIPGSGPTDLHGNNTQTLKTNTYDYLALVFQQEGISTLQIDKRGVGESTAGEGESSLTYTSLVEDMGAWIAFVQMQGFHDILLVGHSEGGQMALTLGIEKEWKTTLSGLFLFAPPAEHPADLLWDQMVPRQISAESEYGKFIRAGLDSLRTGYLLSSEIPLPLYPLFRPSVQPYMRDWFQDSPMENLSKIREELPLYVFFGGADIQVQPTETIKVLMEQRKGISEFLLSPSMTHTLKRDVLGSPMATYTNPSLPLDADMEEKLRAAIQSVKDDIAAR
jgi:uncharacterized protein